MTVDSWQIIYDQAGDLVDAILHEQPKSEFDAIDFEEAINSKAEEIAWRGIKPEDDWSTIIRPVKKGVKLDNKIDEHFHTALRQGVFVRLLYEGEMQIIIKYYSDSSQPGKLFKVGAKMVSAFSCAQQHATAWRLLNEVRNNSYEVRQEKAQAARNEKKEEREILLRGLVKGALSKRPANGWPGHVRAAQTIAKTLFPLIDEYNLPLPNDEDQLSEQIEKLIFHEPILRKAYNDSAKEPLPEPVKLRKVNVDVTP
ncbi:hypothetical protein K7H09_03550 [Halomonas sp. IOP_14]|uniref:hypothetical protein n=1 Tax=Halomonas sp. IOP_14 TaxID=2873295 RepID=UPI001E4E0D3D|nr:hypothetical protein [Halomonas sp. IOP_14]MCD1585080.1 hypothetical protein [Halomonas sp. IOP_14]